MKKKGLFKKEKGITIIALIVTIIVLVVLATVAINITFNGGIIGYGSSGANKYKTAAQEEQNMLNDIIKILGSNRDGLTGEEVETLIDYKLSDMQTKIDNLKEENNTLKTTVAALQGTIATLESSKSKKPELINRQWALSASAIPHASETVLETFSFKDKGYTTGKAIITYSVMTNLANSVYVGAWIEQCEGTTWKNCAADNEVELSSNDTLEANPSLYLDFNENTNIKFKVWTTWKNGTPTKVHYSYSILIIPD